MERNQEKIGARGKLKPSSESNEAHHVKPVGMNYPVWDCSQYLKVKNQ